MTATETFTLRISREDRKMLSELAKIVGRSQADTIRFVVRETLNAFHAESNQATAPFPNNSNTQEGSNDTR